MPQLTCPYCKCLSESKFIHKQHLRDVHFDLFSKNINTTITGAGCELQLKPIVLDITSIDCVVVDQNQALVRLKSNDRQLNLTFPSSVIHLLHKMLGDSFEEVYYDSSDSNE